MTNKYVEVLMEFATSKEIDRTFTYGVPEHLADDIEVGMRVFVPFGRGNKLKEGYVLGFANTPQVPPSRMKNINSMIDGFPVFSLNMIQLAYYMREHYGCTLAAALDAMLPPSTKEKPIATSKKSIAYVKISCSTEKLYEYMESIGEKKSFKNQYDVLRFLLENKEVPTKHVLELLQIGNSAIKTLCKKGIISEHIKEEEYIQKASDISLENHLALNMEQSEALIALSDTFDKKEHNTFLLHGITGSGKTEVFLQLIDKVIKEGKEAIVLVPEISLTPQTVLRFKQRFGNKIGITHSRLNPKERMNQWMLAKEGRISVMIGPRSAVFTPFQNLKLIVIDEEHEGTYKSETTPKYQTKEVAKYRMMQENGILLLASATPDLETYYKATKGEYTLLNLTQRVYNRPLPFVDIVDMRLELSEGNKYIFSNKLYEKINTVLAKKEQVMLFLNRRGHSTFVSCRNCGYVVECKHCNITMTYHLKQDQLMCHYCGKKAPVPKLCPVCNSQYIRYFGDGTQKVEQEAKQLFPDARIARMDVDTTTKVNSHEKILQSFRNGEIDILIGTQMIAKGHDFPNVTLVGILAADTSLHMQDFRATEKTFQLLTQVMGRAGRGEIPGEVVVQTYSPDHYCIQMAAKQDFTVFYNEEILLREQMGYPPFSHIFSVLISGTDEDETISWAHRLMEYYKLYNKNDDFDLYGPIPAAISKIADVYRWRIIIKYEERNRLKNYGLYCITKMKEMDKPSTVEIQGDINPLVLY